jgi:glucose-6-phosphate isomerase
VHETIPRRGLGKILDLIVFLALDDLKYIHDKDKEDALGVAEKQWEQLLIDVTPSKPLVFGEVYNVVLAGMGGSALPGVFLTAWPRLKEPFEICRDYAVPAYVDKDTLVIVSSYSGNTEETIDSLKTALNKGLRTFVISLEIRISNDFKTTVNGESVPAWEFLLKRYLLKPKN